MLWSREKRIAIVDAFDDNNTLDDEVFETEVDAELAKQLEIAEGIIDLLEVNEKQAHALYRRRQLSVRTGKERLRRIQGRTKPFARAAFRAGTSAR